MYRTDYRIEYTVLFQKSTGTEYRGTFYVLSIHHCL